jgi:hypothetical protein
VAVVFGGTACSIAGLDNTKSYWLRLFNPQGYSHWFPVGWQTGNSSGAPMVISVPAFEGPIISPPVSGAPASLSGAGLTTSPGDLLQTGGLRVDDADADGIYLSTSSTIFLAAGGGITIASTSTTVELSSTTSVFLNAPNVDIAGNIVLAKDGYGNPKIGFFAATPVDQPATPVTLTDVINALIALGLVAP